MHGMVSMVDIPRFGVRQAQIDVEPGAIKRVAFRASPRR